MSPEHHRSAARLLASERSGSGRRVALVHGFTQSASSWRPLSSLLARSFEVIAVDLPDHAESRLVHAANLDDAAELLGATCGSASYVGYSLGGRVTLTLALAHGELFNSLVLVSATAGILDEALRAERRAADEALALRLDPGDGGRAPSLEEFLAEWHAGPLFAHLDADQFDLSSRLNNTTAGLAASLRTTGTGTQTPSFGRLGELSMPVLLIAGSEDARFSALAHEMADAIGDNARVEIVAESGHAVPFEKPGRFLELLSNFLAETGNR